jgi:U3 small nucleolar RNA-associated protein 20
LQHQYYATFPDDPEYPTLIRAGVFHLPSSAVLEETVHEVQLPPLPVSILKTRLVLFLKVFAVVPSPKQLIHHQALYRYYSIILSKPDTVVTKLALDCILTYKPEEIMPYHTSLKRFLEDGSLRDELLTFDPTLATSVKSGSSGEGIELEHRPVVIPMIIRILYGRFVSKPKGSKSAREQGLSRSVKLTSE